MADMPDLGARIATRLADRPDLSPTLANALLALANPDAGPFADWDFRPGQRAALDAALESLAEMPPTPSAISDVIGFLDQARAARAPAPLDASIAGWQVELDAMRALLAAGQEGSAGTLRAGLRLLARRLPDLQA